VYNGGEEIVENVEVIRRSVAAGLEGEEVEIIVVSDGSIDGTPERLLSSRSDAGIRVIHYDRNLGKGYAVKAGALASHGDWIALVDSDLDLDPSSIPRYLDEARSGKLDLAIGSKRHPESVVQYPYSRRVASWCYQQLNRILFRLDVRDTQVGLKVFSRRVADEVLPLLLVKRFAFDLELLAVATALGYGRIRELPVRLDYRFKGSGVRSLAVLGALWDTAAIYYRLRILHTYARKRRLLRGSSAMRPEELPLVSLVGAEEAAPLLDYPHLELAREVPAARGELVAVLARGARPAGNWVSAAVPYFADHDVAAVVVPALTPLDVPLRERAAAAVLESHLGGASRRSRYFPGNVRLVSDYPAESVVVRRGDLVMAQGAGIDADQLVAWLAAHGRRTVYTPETSVAAAPPTLVCPHLSATYAHARVRGALARRTRGASLSVATTLSLLPAACAAAGLALLLSGAGDAWRVGAVLVAAYGAVIGGSGALAALRFRSVRVGVLATLTLVATQAAYVAGFLYGIVRGR
jgi:glycosyltransferase involved in cell wall biosynthesis